MEKKNTGISYTSNFETTCLYYVINYLKNTIEYQPKLKKIKSKYGHEIRVNLNEKATNYGHKSSSQNMTMGAM